MFTVSLLNAYPTHKAELKHEGGQVKAIPRSCLSFLFSALRIILCTYTALDMPAIRNLSIRRSRRISNLPPRSNPGESWPAYLLGYTMLTFL